jgi:tetratricopeptide (TPR) repeat protein
VQQTSYGWGFAGDVTAVDVSDLSDINKPLLLAYDYKREKYGDWENGRIGAPFPPIGVDVAVDGKKPDRPIILGAPGTIVYKAEVDLPPGYSVTVPLRVDLKEDFAEFHASYDAKLGVLTATRELTIKQPNVSVGNWEKYQKFAKAISDDHDSWIMLNEAGKPGISKPSSDAQAEQLFDEGLTALRNHDLTRSEDLYTQLIKIDPTYPYAHSNLGTVYLGEDRIADGIKELRKEEDLHSEETYSYRTLGWALQNQHDTAGAIEQYQKLLNLDPKDRDAAMDLAQVLEGEKRYPDAIGVLEKAMSYASDSIPLQSYLGFAYIRNGENDKGLALLQKVVDAKPDSTRSAAELNGIAYTLMGLNAGPDLAQKAADKSLHMQEAASLKSTGNEALSNTSLLGATWDTVGWIYFKEGRFQKALPYLRASWLLTQNPEVGDHLGQLYAKLEKKQEAAHTYQLAYFAMSRNTPFAAGKAILDKIKQHYQELMGANAEIGANAAHRQKDGSFSPMPVEELSRMREVKISREAHPSAHGTFEVVLSPGKGEEVTQIDGDESLKALSEKIKEAKYNVEFPDVGPVRIVRRGILSCGSLGCDLVLLQPDDRSLFVAQ